MAETKIFVSYSRHDAEAVGRVVEALRRHDGFTVFKDTEDILPTEEWKDRLENLILAADTIVFCLSPNSAASNVCAWEVETAERLNKRIAPLVIAPVEGLAVPGGLAKLNYIFATEPHGFERAIEALVSALGTDITWIREHTRIGELTQRWLNQRERKAALLRGEELSDAEKWAKYQPSNAPPLTSEMGRFLALSRKEANASVRRTRRTNAAIITLLLGIIAGLLAFINKPFIDRQIYWWTKIRPYILTAEADAALAPGSQFRECADCPEMVVVPPGKFMMGSAPEYGLPQEHPQRQVTISYPFAIGRFEVTFDQWDACVADGGCSDYGTCGAGDQEWGRGSRPVINISWPEAKDYVAWLSRATGKPYRLLTEAEWEYAARAGSQDTWSFGDLAEIHDYAWYLDNSSHENSGSELGVPFFRSTHPVGKLKPNAFNLFDVHGNAAEWVEDCYFESHENAPTDGSARQSETCQERVTRGGSFDEDEIAVRSAHRIGQRTSIRSNGIGFRIARTIAPPRTP